MLYSLDRGMGNTVFSLTPVRSPEERERMVHCRSFTPATELAQRPSAKYQSDVCCSMPMNLAASNPPLTPLRRGTGLLPAWEGLGVGSWAPCAHKVRGILSLRERGRVWGKCSLEHAECCIS